LIPVVEIVFLCFMALLAWLWLDSLKAREIALHAARSACAADGLMLLDDTVSIRHIGAARNADGRLGLRRVYAFEYTDSGDNRLKGGVILLGHQVTLINIGMRNRAEVRTLH
jgi:Protein of unknown function (DUF3301)